MLKSPRMQTVLRRLLKLYREFRLDILEILLDHYVVDKQHHKLYSPYGPKIFQPKVLGNKY
jgi:hypothetical protein